MGSKKAIGFLSVALAGATLGVAADNADAAASYFSIAELELFVDGVAEGTGGPSLDEIPDGLSIVAGSAVTTDNAVAFGDAFADTDSEVGPPPTVDLGIGDGVFHGVLAEGGAASPPDSLGFSGITSDGTITMSNDSDMTYTISFGGEFGWTVDVAADDPDSDAEASVVIGIESLLSGATFLSEDPEFNTIDDGDVLTGDGDDIGFFVVLPPDTSETLVIRADAAGSARSTTPVSDVIPEPVTAVLGGLGLAALAANTGRRRGN